MDPTTVDSATPAYGPSGVVVEMSSVQRAPQRSQSTHAPAPADAASCLQQLDEDVARDVRAAHVRTAILQEEVDSLLARVANAHDTAAGGREDCVDAVLERVQAIRQARND
ncbi:hypothetical protein CGC20_28220 [Leishmania donovani]|uniref:Uncharacterized protein n=1 Tax=Leishmania donovani TaxID=5661 RepID=A0A504WZL4_LEIDO|nr:hypothetical protein CGC20_28220 [Leishmania donovani]